MKEDKKVYDMEERTALFGENIIDLVVNFDTWI